MKNDELDKILERAISTYSREESRPGLEARVFRRIREPRKLNFRTRALILAVPAFACVLLLAITFSIKHESISLPAQPGIIANGSIVEPALPPITTVKQWRGSQTTKSKRVRPATPKREQFPTPTPLTDQERALLALVAGPPNQMAVLLNPEMRKVEPIHIAEIRIEPLQESGQE